MKSVRVRRQGLSGLGKMSMRLEDALAAMTVATSQIIGSDDEAVVLDLAALRAVRRVGRILLEEAAGPSRRGRSEVAASNVLQFAA